LGVKSCCAVVAIGLALLWGAAARAEVTESDFGSLRDGTAVRLFTIGNKSGAAVKIMTYGAAVVSLKVPDRAGKLDDVVLGYDSLEGYLGNDPFFGAIVGRYANRIHGAAFSLGGTVYHVNANDHGNTLHGGRRGFDKVAWTGAKADEQSVDFTYLSKDGDQGFPGNLTARVRYSFSDDDQLTIDYLATTDKETVVNLTNHCYFNLAGAGNGDALGHELSIDADQFTPTDAHGIPTGKLEDVAGTVFDFRTAHSIGERMGADDEQLHLANGYDENFVLNKIDGRHAAATVYEPTTGRVLEIITTQPGVQLYSGNGLNGTITGKEGKTYVRHGAFCLEPEHFPDSPNHPEFPTTELKPGETYHQVTVYQFSTRPAAMAGAADSVPTSATAPSMAEAIHLTTGWRALQEGAAAGTIEQDAAHPTNAHPHLLKISVTKTAGPGEGRAGAISNVSLAVEQGEWCDVTFSAVTEQGSVGLVFSLENAEGKVLARTTLPEIGGRGRRRGGPTTAPATWNNYLVSLHVRAADASAHVVITPIELTTIWINGLTLTPRPAAK
jgi:aldose 1-epimerase